jgi:DNA-binding transcriptional MerR regulator
VPDTTQLYDLADLSARARVTPRTVRYYIQQGLLRAPGVTGPGAKYGEGHLNRLRLIRRLQQAHLPLAEIRRRLEAISDAEVRDLLSPDTSTSEVRLSRAGTAADYAQGLLSAMAAAGPAAVRSPAPAPPPPAAGRSQWERISLTPDLELHVRRPLSREHNKLVDQLLAHARRLLEEETP